MADTTDTKTQPAAAPTAPAKTAKADEGPIKFEVGKSYTFNYRNSAKTAKVLEIAQGGRVLVVKANGAPNNEVIEVDEVQDLARA